MTDTNQSKSENSTRRERIWRVTNDCLRRLEQGEKVTDESVIRHYPDLMPELAEELRNLRLIHEARWQVDQNGSSDVSRAGTSSDDGLHVRCPHCRGRVEVAGDVSFAEITCSSCGSRFSLVDDDEQTNKTPAHEQIAHFQLLSRLGSGGFGTVWKAHDTELDRMVAVKIPRREQVDPVHVQMLLREARAAAQLKHPHIVAVHEVGRDGDAVYIVTDLVEGVTLSEWIELYPCSPRDTARLAQTIAHALHHAHQAGVVHRDLKPPNIMMDPAGEPHIMDFGLARREAGEITMTVDGHMLGTPAYMSPEQAKGEAHQADRRSDVYSLGVILFELLTGELPFRGNPRMLVQQVLQDEPPSPRKLNGRIPRDLETICLKCLEKKLDDRFPSAEALASELGRFLAGQPVSIRPITPVRRGWRWCARNPIVAALCVMVASLLLFLSVAGPVVAYRQRSLAAETRRLLYRSDMKLALQAWEAGDVGRVRTLIDRHEPVTGQKDWRSFEWYYLWRLCATAEAVPSLAPDTNIECLAFSRDGRTLAVGGMDQLITLWDVADRRIIRTLAGHKGYIASLAFAPDGQSLATGSEDGAIKLWDAATGNLIKTLDGHRATVWAVAFSPDGKTLVSGAHQPSADAEDDTVGNVKLWDVSTGALQRKMLGHASPVWSLAYSPDGNTLVAGGGRNITVWRIREGGVGRSFEAHAGTVRAVAFSKDGAALASASTDETVKLWSVDTSAVLEEKSLLEGHSNGVLCVAFSPDGSTLASAGEDNTVRLWRLETGVLLDTLRGHSGAIWSLAYTPDGATIASGGADQMVKLWPMSRRQVEDIQAGDGTVVTAFAPDGRAFASGTVDGSVKVWDAESGSLVMNIRAHEAGVSSVDFSMDGRTLASSGDNGTVKLWDLLDGTLTRSFQGHNEGIWSIVFSPDGSLLASSGLDDRVVLWDPANGKPVWTIEDHAADVPCIAFSPDGQTLASGSQDLSVLLWDVPSRSKKREFTRFSGAVWSLAFSPDGATLATAAANNKLQFWDLDSGEEITEIAGTVPWVWSMAFAPDGRTLFLGSADKTIKLWDMSTGDERVALIGHNRTVSAMALAPDGHTLVSGDGQGVLRLWRAAHEEEVVVSSRQSGQRRTRGR